MAPPADFDAWQAVEERRQAAATEAAARLGARLGGLFGLERDNDDDDRMAMLQERLAQLQRRRADDDGQEAPAPAANMFQRMLQRHLEERERQRRMGQADGNQPRPAQGAANQAAAVAAGAAAPAAPAVPPAANQPQAAGRAHRGWGPLPNADVAAIGQRGNALAVAPDAGEEGAAAAQAVEIAAEVEDAPPPALEADEPAGLGPEEEEVEEAPPAVEQPVADGPPGLEAAEEKVEQAPPAVEQPVEAPPARAGRRMRAGPQQEQRPMNRQQRLERGWGRPAVAKRDGLQAGAARRQAAGRGAAV